MTASPVITLSKEDNVIEYSLKHKEDSPKVIIGTTTVEDLDTSFAFNNPLFDTQIIPPAVRWMSSDSRILLWERPPCFVPFLISHKYQRQLDADEAPQKTFRLAIPWQRYIVALNSEAFPCMVVMSFHNDQMRSLDEPLTLPPFPNFYQDGHLCLASYNNYPIGRNTIQDAINATYNIVWGSGFNHDTVAGYQQIATIDRALNPLAGFYEDINKFYTKWSTYSIEDVLKFTWPINRNYPTARSFLSHKSVSRIVSNFRQPSYLNIKQTLEDII